MIELRLPKFEETAESAMVSRWLKQPGETVASGEAVVEMETEKFVHPIEAPADAILREQCVSEGEQVEVGTVLALLEPR